MPRQANERPRGDHRRHALRDFMQNLTYPCDLRHLSFHTRSDFNPPCEFSKHPKIHRRTTIGRFGFVPLPRKFSDCFPKNVKTVDARI